MYVAFNRPLGEILGSHSDHDGSSKRLWKVYKILATPQITAIFILSLVGKWPLKLM